MEAPTKLRSVRSKYNWEAAWTLFLSGATMEETSMMLSIPFRSVVDYAGRHFWGPRRTQALQVAKQAVRNDLKQRIEKQRAAHTHKMLDQLDETMTHIEAMPIDNEKNPVERKLSALDRQDLVARRVLGMDKPETEDPLKNGFMLLAAMGRSLVSESELILDAEIVESQTQEAKESEQNKTSGGSEEDQIIPLPLPIPSDDPRGLSLSILRSRNGISDDADTAEFHPFAPETPKIGETGLTEALKPMPAKINMDYTPPKPLIQEDTTLVNETPQDEPTARTDPPTKSE